MFGNLANGALIIALAALLLAFGKLIEWTITELPEIIADAREFRKWRKSHTRVFF